MSAVDYDVVIVGGGLVGASLCCALGELPLRVAMIEAVPLAAESQPSFDERTLALAYGSKRIFDALGVWSGIESRGAWPIRQIHVSDRGYPGLTRLDSKAAAVEALGYVVASRVIGAALMERLAHVGRLELLCPAELTGLEIRAEQARLTVQSGDGVRRISTRLVVGADGGHSVVRELMGIATRDHDYHQTAIVSNITTQRFHGHTAYERFTSSGPLAVLPASCEGDTGAAQNRCALVWTVRSTDAEAILALPDAVFLARLQQRFGTRLGRILHAGRRHAYPLSLRQAREHVRPRLALVGNAAHTLHPVAGQGFNLGLRDVAALAQVLAEADGEDPGCMAVLGTYAGWRTRDHRRVITFTDSLVRLFSNRFLPLAVARNLGLVAADLLPPVKQSLTRRAMGMAGRLPRLARGLPLRGGQHERDQ